jgi:hypothetical protein
LFHHSFYSMEEYYEYNENTFKKKLLKFIVWLVFYITLYLYNSIQFNVLLDRCYNFSAVHLEYWYYYMTISKSVVYIPVYDTWEVNNYYYYYYYY